MLKMDGKLKRGKKEKKGKKGKKYGECLKIWRYEGSMKRVKKWRCTKNIKRMENCEKDLEENRGQNVQLVGNSCSGANMPMVLGKRR